MPERDKAVLFIAKTLLGSESPDPEDKVPTIILDCQPRGVRKAPWQGLRAIIDYLFVLAMERVDWSRVLRQAGARHREMVRRDADHATDQAMLADLFGGDDPLCGACLVEALFSDSTMGPEEDGTPVPRHPLWREDWLAEAGGVMEVLRIVAPLVAEAGARGWLEADAYEQEPE